jgi:hypothetical protein
MENYSPHHGVLTSSWCCQMAEITWLKATQIVQAP